MNPTKGERRQNLNFARHEDAGCFIKVRLFVLRAGLRITERETMSSSSTGSELGDEDAIDESDKENDFILKNASAELSMEQMSNT